MRILRAFFLLLSGVIAAAPLSGCGNRGPERIVVAGQVTYQGKPVPDGMIRFVPLPTCPTPAAGAKIVDGRYTADTHGGVPVGEYKVKIEAFRNSTGRSPAGRPVSLPFDDQREQYLPEKFNKQTQLEITIPSGSKAIAKDFQLTD